MESAQPGVAPETTPSKRRGRPPKQPLTQVRAAVINAALAAVDEAGPQMGLDNVSYEDAIKSAGTMRSAAYRIWPHRGDFINDVLAAGASQRLFGDSELGPRTLAAMEAALAVNADKFHSVDGRRQALLDLVRQSFPVWVDELANSTRWRLRAALAAAYGEPAGRSGETPGSAIHVAESIQGAEVDHLNATTRLVQLLRDLMGLRLRTPSMTDDLLAESAAALVQGWAVTERVVAAADSRDGDDVRGRLARTVVGPDGRIDWSPGAVAFLAVLDAFTELVPQDEYQPPSHAAIAEIRALGGTRGPAASDAAAVSAESVRASNTTRPGHTDADELPSDFPMSDVLAGHTGPVRCLAATVMPDGVVLASGSEDGTIRLWDPVSGEQAGPTMTGHDGWVLGLTFVTFDGNTVVASAGHDGTVRLWNPDDGSVRAVLTGHTGWVAALAYLDVADVPTLASGGADGTIRLWDLATGALAAAPIPTGDRHIESLAAARVGDSDLLAVAGPRTGLRLFDPARSTWRELTGSPERVRSCDFTTTADGTVALVAGCGNAVRRWDAATGRSLGLPWQTGAHQLASVSAIRDANGAEVVAAGGDRGWLGVFGGPSQVPRQPRQSMGATVRAVSLVTLADGRTVVASAVGDRVLLWDASVRPLLSLDSVPNRLGDDVRERAAQAVNRLPGAAESLQLFEDAAVGSMGLGQARALARQRRPAASVSTFEGMGIEPDTVVNRLLAVDET